MKKLLLFAIVALMFGSCKKEKEVTPSAPPATLVCNDSVYFKWKTIFPYPDSTYDANSYFIADSVFRRRGDEFQAVLGSTLTCKIQIYINNILRKDTIVYAGGTGRLYIKPSGCTETNIYSVPF